MRFEGSNSTKMRLRPGLCPAERTCVLPQIPYLDLRKKAKENGIKRKIYKGRKKVIKREKGLEVPQNKAEKNLFF